MILHKNYTVKTVHTIWNCEELAVRIRQYDDDNQNTFFDIEVSKDNSRTWTYWRTAMDYEQAEREANILFDNLE